MKATDLSVPDTPHFAATKDVVNPFNSQTPPLEPVITNSTPTVSTVVQTVSTTLVANSVSILLELDPTMATDPSALDFSLGVVTKVAVKPFNNQILKLELDIINSILLVCQVAQTV